MENTEKLNNFSRWALEAANKRSSQDMRKFTEELERQTEEFREQTRKELTECYHMEAEKRRRELNRQISQALIHQKRRLYEHQQQKKAELFALVEKKLLAYRKTDAYDSYLVSKIRMALEFAGEEEIEIYIDPGDQKKKRYLEQTCRCRILVCAEEFGGGIKAVVPSKNILIDESFGTKLNQEREAYTF